MEALGESNVSIRYLAWVDQRAVDLLKVRSEAIRRVKGALDEAGVSLPAPTYAVRLHREGEPAETARRPPPPPAAAPGAPVPDVGRGDVVERQTAADRAATGPDLLDSAAPREL